MPHACSILFPLLASAQPQTPARAPDRDGEELFANPSFAAEARGWTLKDAEVLADSGPDGAPSVLLKGVRPGRGAWSHVGAVLAAKVERKLRFHCSVQGTEAKQSVSINAFGYTKDKTSAGIWTQSFALDADAWKRLDAEYVLDADADTFTIYVINQSGADLLVADAHLVAGEPAEAKLVALNGTGVIRASAATIVQPGDGAEGVVTFPIPGTYRAQLPLTFALTVEPPEALVSWRWKLRADGMNWLCEARVRPPEQGAQVSWESFVLVDDPGARELPIAAEPEVPEEARPWLRATACVQSTDGGIQREAAELARGKANLNEFVASVIQFTRQNQGQGQKLDTLDAVRALACGGSCTSRANLCAALLRAHGIPARTLAHLPTWSGPLYEHWLVEYWHPGVGWVWLESTRGELQPRFSSAVVLNVAEPEDEDGAFDGALTHTGVMLGAPLNAVHRHSSELRPFGAMTSRLPQASNVAEPILRLRLAAPEHDELLRDAQRVHDALREGALAGKIDAERNARIAESARSGDPRALLALLASL